MNDSILITIKKLLAISDEDDCFDLDVIIHINSVFMDLTQLGVGPEAGFMIEDGGPVWSDFIPDPGKFEAVKTYMYLRVKLLFDPPTSSAAIEAMNKQIDKLEWRLNVAAESKL